MFTIAATFATCPVCTANTVPYGWLVLSATVLGLAIAGAGMTAWFDGRGRDAYGDGTMRFQHTDRN